MQANPRLSTTITANVQAALREDVGAGDLTAALVPAEQQAVARLITREEAVICGTDWFNEVFAQLDGAIGIDWRVADGDVVQANDLLCQLRGPARALLTGERTAMNFLQTLSGTATAARAFSMAIKDTATVILDTRKTIPGLRRAQKYAVRCGGCHNHRLGLYDAYLIKENHIAAAGSITEAVVQAAAQAGDTKVEVEVENLQQLEEAIEAGAHFVLLDNFTVTQMQEAVKLNAGRVQLEVSGGVTLDSVRQFAETGVDFISVGELTKHVQAVDFSMRMLAG